MQKQHPNIYTKRGGEFYFDFWKYGVNHAVLFVSYENSPYTFIYEKYHTFIKS